MTHITSSLRSARLIVIAACMVALGMATAPASAASKPSKAPAEPSEHEDAPDPRGAEGRRRDSQQRPCASPARRVSGLGDACRTPDGLWKVKLPGGGFDTSHGPDHPEGSGATGVLHGTPRVPKCTSQNPHGSYAFVALIASAPDVVADETQASMRARVNQANGAFYEAAVESGSPNGADLVFACDAAGQVLVKQVTLPTTRAQTTWNTLVRDLSNAGFNKSGEKYAVWFEGQPGGLGGGGIGSYTSDESDSVTNGNNAGATYAIAWTSTETLLHEIGHNLGTVGATAPYSTGTGDTNGNHCWEGQDVMCYNDGASRDPGTITWNCVDFDHFDCRHDTYFDAKIGAGQGVAAGAYLDTHWNAGECYVRWIVNAACTTSDTTSPTVSTPVQQPGLGTQVGATVTVNERWTATDVSGIAAYSVWVSTNGGTWTQVTLPTPTTTTRNFALTPGASYRFAVSAKDGAGNWSAYAYGPTFVVSVKDDNNAAISYNGGTWTRSAWTPAYGGAQVRSTSTNAYARFTFTGRNVAWVAPTSTIGGQAFVYVDGVYKATVNLNATTTTARKQVWRWNWSASGSHTIDVQVAGTAGHPQVDIDAFVVIR